MRFDVLLSLILGAASGVFLFFLFGRRPKSIKDEPEEPKPFDKAPDTIKEADMKEEVTVLYATTSSTSASLAEELI
jgi:hypothetical protein